ncbi:hypothetical protein SLS56_009517 [Neofusicoccum ribis]|uniref:Glutathione S-transferase n=1 Tax=Neofusicoccum ribis TaxID=45134 RepID=A0ABR3SHV3_9PEZI
MPTTQPNLLYDGEAANTYAVRLFILERGGLSLSVRTIDVASLENRKPPYRTTVNRRGEAPALRIGNGGFVLTEITAVCEHLDEVAGGGRSLLGATPLERAEMRMWLRRVDLEIAQPVVVWFRNAPESVGLYRGHRVPSPEARLSQVVAVNRLLNLLDEEQEGKTRLCGDRFSAADVHFYGLVMLMVMGPAGWVRSPGGRNVEAYFERMEGGGAGGVEAV